MFDVRYIKKICIWLISLCMGAVAWALIIPVQFCVPRKKNWLAIIGRSNGLFVDNTKYFFLQAGPLLARNTRYVLITEHESVVELLKGSGYEVMRYPSLRAFFFMLRAGCIIADADDWSAHLRGHILRGAKLVQLWHGVGFKRIGLDWLRNEAQAKAGWLSAKHVITLRRAGAIIKGRLHKYHLLNVTSQFYRDNVFVPAMPSHHYLVAGYPRNTFGQLVASDARKLVWKTVDAAVRRKLENWIKKDRKIVLITPTFRDTRATPMNLDSKTTTMLDRWCDSRGVELVFKFHPSEKGANAVEGKHLHVCEKRADIYPLMPYSAALITDYSSIYMDYLLLDRPVIFYVPDLQEYIEQDRQIQFSYKDVTPGPKTETWEGVIAQLDKQWRNDEYWGEREELKNKAFDGVLQKNSSKMIIDFIYRKNWVN